MRIARAAGLPIALAALLGCSEPGHADPLPPPTSTENHKTSSVSAPALQTPPEASLGVADTGIFSDLDARVQLPAPTGTSAAYIDRERQLLLVYANDWPTKVYPLGHLPEGPSPPQARDILAMLRPGDAAELAATLGSDALPILARRPDRAGGDLDRDGIPDQLDLLIGGKKTVLNGASYGAGYIAIPYPGGDVPRDVGVCTDVVIRAARNAGLDLQRELSRDIRRAKRAYPMVKGKGNRNIDHRRVKTLLPYFKRRWSQRSKATSDPRDPLRPGDIVFLDTFPSRSGPDHIGIVSDVMGESGLPLVINNWTNGYVTSEMDILSFVPVTHRFRFPTK